MQKETLTKDHVDLELLIGVSFYKQDDRNGVKRYGWRFDFDPLNGHCDREPLDAENRPRFKTHESAVNNCLHILRQDSKRVAAAKREAIEGINYRNTKKGF